MDPGPDVTLAYGAVVPRWEPGQKECRCGQLTYEVLVLDGTPRAGEQRLPSGESIVSSPLSVVLIAGEQTAVLVDAPYTYGQVERVCNWDRRLGQAAGVGVHHARPRGSLARSCRADQLVPRGDGVRDTGHLAHDGEPGHRRAGPVVGQGVPRV